MPAERIVLDIGVAIRRRLAGFLVVLRDNGFRLGVAESRDALAILAGEGLGRAGMARGALRALLCGRRTDWERFDQLFDAYWLGRGVRQRSRPAASQAGAAGPMGGGSAGPLAGLALQAGRDGGSPAEEGGAAGQSEGASRHERLASTDFRKIADPQAQAEAHAIAGRLARAMRARLTRRDRAARRGRAIDLRRTLRASLPTGGMPFDLVRARRRYTPLRLVVLLDASGSMNLYTATFVRFVHGILDNFLEAEAFLFHTRLVHVSEALREKDAGRALDRLGLMAEGVGGGTRIGESLATFNRWHAARVIHSRTCVMILSDGYDTGPPERLGAEMAALRRRCRRIVWLNPMIGWEGYEPSARGMAAALPHIDLFAPAHTLESLAELEPYLARI
ncbi:vWA domain-containing protein [Labrys monachus]|uniref:Uncharacterized protein with von Willebrand factor type A (VWA) domain n=1 Tax=Labrys monachus TaxID=217067 RepID=A0ABU0F9L3_9HYPH|nr:VWA domain-containing protein [Labrys monachus]MDQ0391022.1 uncharacterized protein with von Willebrand factor type A (vWA) domain [Labrys monachus]